jgi:hypothetical protein
VLHGAALRNTAQLVDEPEVVEFGWAEATGVFGLGLEAVRAALGLDELHFSRGELGWRKALTGSLRCFGGVKPQAHLNAMG